MMTVNFFVIKLGKLDLREVFREYIGKSIAQILGSLDIYVYLLRVLKPLMAILRKPKLNHNKNEKNYYNIIFSNRTTCIWTK